MTQISRNPLGKETNKEIQATLWWLLARLNNDSDIEKFLDGLLTKTEKIMLAKRLSIGFLIGKGYNYRNICDTLKVSIATVCRIKEMIDRADNDYGFFIKKLEKRRELKKFSEDVDRLIQKLSNFIPPQKNDMKGRNRWLKY
jgi:uncharacterized protein YerC